MRRRRWSIGFIVLISTACATVGQQHDDRSVTNAEFDWNLPPGFVPPPVPESNPITAEKVQLGRRLFYDNRLSVHELGSCGSCHQQHLAFTDGRAHAIGVTGESHARSSMSLINVAYNKNLTWASRELQTLEQQIEIPLFNEQPVELGVTGREAALIKDLREDPTYAMLFQSAFPYSDEKVSIKNIIRALASFVRSIVAADSAFDRHLYLDDQSAVSESARRGMRLFYSDELNCGACHQGQNIAGGQFERDRPQEPTEFHNTGLYNVGGHDRYPIADPGLRSESGLPEDDGRFRAPSLRNIAVTAPYMHDGSIATLSAVIDHYAAGGRSIDQGQNAGIGNVNSRKSQLLTGFELSVTEKEDLLEFLDSLTDYSVLHDKRFSKPEDDDFDYRLPSDAAKFLQR